LSGDANPYPNLRDLFRGYPFGSAGGPRPPRGLGRLGAGLSWDRDVGPLLRLRCGGCHVGGVGEGGFLVSTLAQVQNGSPRTRASGHTMIVPGDPDRSFLRTMLVGPPAPFRQMPLLSPLPNSEIQLITDWIRAGALEHPTSIPEPPPPGAALAQVLFRNLLALHLDRVTGFLHHRNEGGEVSRYASAVATGACLQALAALARALPDLAYEGMRPADALAVAAARALLLLDAAGVVSAGEEEAAGVLVERAGLAGQAALAAGLSAAAPLLPAMPEVDAAARRCAERFVVAHCQIEGGLLLLEPGYPATRVTATVLADALAALRLAAGALVAGAEVARDQVVASLQARWTFAEWAGRGEILDDGNPDTDGNGIREPGAAGGSHGRLPVFASELRAGGDEGLPPAAELATWSEHVRPLFETKCGECHLHGAAQGSYRLDTLALLRTPGESGGVLPLLVPGDPEASLLWRKVVDRAPPIGGQMPLQRPPLDAKTKEIVRRWILDGAGGR
jgi:hypothetical protein